LLDLVNFTIKRGFNLGEFYKAAAVDALEKEFYNSLSPDDWRWFTGSLVFRKALELDESR
jgi:hypothetical protein